MRRIEDGQHLPHPGLCEPVAAETVEDTVGDGLDDATLAYVLASRPLFEQLRRAAGQIAGLLVLAAAGGRSAQDHPMLGLAASARDEALDGLRGLPVPQAAAHHHRHLMRAARAVSAAVDAAGRGLHRRDDAALDAALLPLRAGYQELQWATGALPGFAMVAFDQACCAGHRAVKPRAGSPGRAA
jgi:hypothetical protein